MKKSKKIVFILLAVTIVIQLAFPIGSIIKKNNLRLGLEKKGEVFKIEIMPLSYENYFEDGEARIDFDFKGREYQLGKKYAVFSAGEDGFGKFEMAANRPKDTNSYVKGADGYWYFQLDESEFKGEKYENLRRVNFITDDSRFSIDPDGYIDVGIEKAYVEAKIYKGALKVLGYYVDGKPLESVLEYYNDNFDSLYNVYIGNF